MLETFQRGKDREEKIDKFLDNLAWFHSQKDMPTGFFSTIGRIDEKLGKLNENIQQSNESSGKLTKALNRITLAGVVIAGLSLAVAISAIVLQIFGVIK